MLKSKRHVSDARSLESRIQHASEVREAVRQRVDVGTTGNLRLGILKLRLQGLNLGSDRPDRLPANLGCDVQRLPGNIDLIHDRTIREQNRTSWTQSQAAVVLSAR